MSNVILPVIVVLICASCSAHHSKNSSVKIAAKDSVYTKDTNTRPELTNTNCATCSDKNNPPVWYIWDSKRFFW